MSVNAVDQTTGNTTPLAGNTNNLVGNLSALTTNTKSDAVGAINEVNQTKQNATDNNLQTTDKTVAGAINELKSGLTGLVKTHTETGLTTNIYGICNLTLPSTNYVVDAVCGNYIVIPYRSSAGNHWELVVTDVGQDGAITVQGNKTVDVVVHYI